MIDLWRKKFTYAPKNMPFIVMQLPNWSDGHGEDYVSENVNWPAMRQAQAQAVESVKNAGLAVTIDAGEWNDLHPEKKLTGGSIELLTRIHVNNHHFEWKETTDFRALLFK